MARSRNNSRTDIANNTANNEKSNDEDSSLINTESDIMKPPRNNSSNTGTAMNSSSTATASEHPLSIMLFRIRVAVLLVIPLLSVIRFSFFDIDYYAFPAYDESDVPEEIWSAAEALQPEVMSVTIPDDDRAEKTSLILRQFLETGKNKKRLSDTLNKHSRNTSSWVFPSSVNYRFNYSDEKKPVRHGVFYNVFIPDETAGQQNALRIVREQVEQIKYSFAAKRSGEHFAVYYVTLGMDGILTPDLMQSYCGHISCIPVEHFSAGSEVVTLAHMHSFCVAPQHEFSHVTYLHNKGSFHYNKVNENWRPILTDAALSEMCLNSTECNLCGLQYYTMWTPFIPGNMFTATCDYVKKLIFPMDFSDRMEKAIGEVVLLRLKQQILTNLLADRKDFFGLERYSDEHWIASHPDVVPCDCDPFGAMWKYHFERLNLSDLSWAMAPRIQGPPAYSKRLWTRKVLAQARLRIREYYYLPGNLVKWFSLYKKAPAPDSWVWSWFHDGNLWKQAVEDHGSNAVHEMTKEYATDIVIPEPTFANDPYLHALSPIVETKNASNLSNSTVVAFFDMVLPTDSTSGEVTAQLQGIHQQLQIVAKSSVPKLYFTTMGHSVLNKTDFCRDHTNLDCVPLKTYDKQYRGEMHRHVHEYCRNNPSHRVVYLRNQLPAYVKDPERRARLVKHLTMAVTSDICLNAVREPDQCNVCGLLFYTMHTLTMAGNMWTSECSYVNQLLEPEEFVSRMREFISKVLLQKIWTRINFGIAEESLDRLGLDGYAMEHWVGSHPNLLPCDLSDQTLPYFMSGLRNASMFALRKGAHTRGFPFYTLNRALEAQVRSNERLRMREFHYLPGNLLKWYELYDTAPPPSSWVWTYFPDGFTWSSGVAKYGRRVVETLTSRYELSELELHQKWADEEAEGM